MIREFFRSLLVRGRKNSPIEPGQSMRANGNQVALDEKKLRKANCKNYRNRIKKLEQLGKIQEAIQLAHEALGSLGSQPELLYDLASLQEINCNVGEARETYRSILEIDISNLRALEKFIELNYIEPGPAGTVTKILTEFAQLLPKDESFDVQASVFLIPGMKLMVSADEAIRRLKYSQSSTARHIASLAISESQDAIGKEELDDSLREAAIVLNLVRGAYEYAYGLMPLDSISNAALLAMKQAIQREIRQNRQGEASELLARYLHFEPSSKWALGTLDQITRNQQVRSRHQLTVHGFPFADHPVVSDYKPDDKKVLYLLHNSLPFDSAGYSTRSQGVISALRAHGWDVQGVTRPGYPMDRHDESSDYRKSALDVVNGNIYHRLIDEAAVAKSTEALEDYVARYSEMLFALALEERPALIHAASNHWNGLAAITAARRLGIPSIYEVRGLWEITEASRNPEWGQSGAFRFMSRMETDAAISATRVLTITSALKDELVRRGVPASKISVIPNGVDPVRFKYTVPEPRFGLQLGLENKTIIGYIGSLVDYEGLSLLINAAYHLRKRRSEFRLLIVGQGPEEKKLKNLVASLDLGDIVVFAGSIPHRSIMPYYSLVDIVALPRLGLPVCEMVSPLKPFEAMAFEKAVVASNVSALAEIVQDGITGILHEKDSVISLTEKLDLLLGDPALRRRLGKNAASWVREERSWSHITSNIVDVYEELLYESDSDENIVESLLKLHDFTRHGNVSLREEVFELGRKNVKTPLGQRLLIHSALNTRSSRYSLRVVKLFAENGLTNAISYLARHSLPSTREESFARLLRSALQRNHDIRLIASVRVSTIELTDHSADLVESIVELLNLAGPEQAASPLSPLFLVIKWSGKDLAVLDKALGVCQSIGIQAIVETSDSQRNARNEVIDIVRSWHDITHTPPLQINAEKSGYFTLYNTFEDFTGTGSLPNFGLFESEQIMEVIGIFWLLRLQTSAVLKLQRRESREYLVNSIRPLVPLESHPGVFGIVAKTLAKDGYVGRYLDRTSAALLSRGYFRGAEELLRQVSLENQDRRHYHRLAEAAFGQADFESVTKFEGQLAKSKRMDKIQTESGAALRILQRAEVAPEKVRESASAVQKPLRVVSFLHASAPDQVGGYANRAHALLQSLVELGMTVRAFTRPGFPSYELEPGNIQKIMHDKVVYHRLGSNLQRESGEYAYMEESIAAYRNILELEKPDVVHLRSTYVSALPGLIAAKEMSIPTVYEVSGMWELVYASYGDARRESLRARTVRMENAVLKHADRIVTLTEAMASEISSRVTTKSEIQLVPNAVDLGRFRPRPRRTDLKESLGWHSEIPVIGYAGSMVDYEGLDLLLHAAAILEKKGLQFKILLIGDGEIKRDLELLTQRLGLNDVVKFTGRLPHRMVEEYYTIFDVCPFPRYFTHATRAVSPLKPFEALASGKPIVVSNIPALQEIVGSNKETPRGLAVEENSPVALSVAIERLLTDPGLRDSLAFNGRRWVSIHRSWGSVSRLFADSLIEAAKDSE